MTRITIETTLDGSEDTMVATVEVSKTAVTLDDMAELVTLVMNGLGFHVAETVFEDNCKGDCKPNGKES